MLGHVVSDMTFRGLCIRLCWLNMNLANTRNLKFAFDDEIITHPEMSVINW